MLVTSDFILSSLIFVAQREDYFKRQGLSVDIVLTPTGKDGLGMALSGRADFATVSTFPLTSAILAGERPHILATIAKSERALVVVANSAHGIAQPADLRGKKVAVKAGTNYDFYLDAILIDAGMSPSQVVKVDMNPDDGLAALKDGTVDAVVQASPFPAGSLAMAGVAVTAIGTPVYTTHWNLVASDAFMISRRATAEKLLRALIEAEAFADRNPGQAVDAAAQWLHRPRASLVEQWRASVFRVQLTQSLVVTMEDETRWVNVGRNSMSPAMPTPDFLDYLDIEPLGKIKPEAVRITR